MTKETDTTAKAALRASGLEKAAERLSLQILQLGCKVLVVKDSSL